MVQQQIRTVNVLGINGCHDEGCRPAAEIFLIDGCKTGRLLRASKAFGKRKRIHEYVDHLGVFSRRRHRRLEAGECPAGERALHRTHTAFNATHYAADFLLRRLLQEKYAQIKGYGVETTGKNNARAAGLRRLAVGRDHVMHPCRLAAQINIVGSGLGASAHHVSSIELIGAHRSQYHLSALHQCIDR